MKRLMAILSCLAAVAWVSGALANSGASPARARMAAAAEALLDSMDDAMRERMQFAFDGSQRRDWHYIPRERHGVNLGELDGLQARAAHELLRSALSDGGYLKAHGVMLLEEILHEALPEEQRRRGARDPGLYSLAIYGDPDPVAPWAWRRGWGRALVEALGQLVAQQPAPIYLEADRPQSVRFYQGLGFENRAELDVLGVRCVCLGRGFRGA